MRSVVIRWGETLAQPAKTRSASAPVILEVSRFCSHVVFIAQPQRMQIGCRVRYVAMVGAAGWITSKRSAPFKSINCGVPVKISDPFHRPLLDLGLIEVRDGSP